MHRALSDDYDERVAGARSENIERVIEHSKLALSVFTPGDFPRDWAITTASLGAAYSERIIGDPVTKLDKAIELYERTLAVYTQAEYPEQWQDTQAILLDLKKRRSRMQPAP